MYTNVLAIRDPEKWKIIQEFLDNVVGGCIVVTPDMSEHLDEHIPGWETKELISYDFNQCPDFEIDVVKHPTDYAVAVIDEQYREKSNPNK